MTVFIPVWRADGQHGPRDRGLLFTTQEDIRLVDFSGSRAWPGRARPPATAPRLGCCYG